jgi:hypothetical protein
LRRAKRGQHVAKPTQYIANRVGETKMTGGSTGLFAFRDEGVRDSVIRSNATTRGSMLSDDEVLMLARSAAQAIQRFGDACGLGAEAQYISNVLRKAAQASKSKSLRAYDVCRTALEGYLRASGFGKPFHIVNSMLRMVKSIPAPTRHCYLTAVTDSCGDLADFARLVWEGLTLRVPGRAEGRGVDLPRCRAFGGSAGGLPQLGWESVQLVDVREFHGEARGSGRVRQSVA